MIRQPRIDSSGLVPTILRRLASHACRNVLLLGCGGGFDFVHGMLLYGDLSRMGKRVTIGSYSFQALGDSIRLAEELPSSAAMAGQFGVDFTNLEVIDRGEQPEADLEELTDE